MGYSQNSLTSSIYEMALGRSSWDVVLNIIAASFPTCMVLVSGDDIVSSENLVVAQRGPRASGVAAYAGGFAGRNPWRSLQSEVGLHQVYHDDDLMVRRTARQSEFWTGWVARQGDFAGFVGVVVLRNGSRQLTLELFYPEADGEALRNRAAILLAEAAGHLGRAIEIASRSRFSAGQGFLEGVVAELPFAVFFVDAQMRIHYANTHAELLRRPSQGPFRGSDGSLRVGEEQADAALRALVRKTAGSQRVLTSALQIGARDGEGRYFALARLAARSVQPYQLHDAILDPGPLVMLVVHGSRDLSSLPTDMLWRAFALTESEAKLAEALLNGSTLADFAKEREVSKQTLRNQLAGVMRKTGMRRQAELVSWLTRLALTCP
jgi:DNA-binding CsgD family transcriptional regulator